MASFATDGASAELSSRSELAPTVFEGLDTVSGRDKSADDRFIGWCRENGVLFPKLLYPFFDPKTGIRGLGAATDIGVGEPLLHVPEKLMITSPMAYEDPDIGHVYVECRECFEIDDDVVSLNSLALA